MSASFKTGMTMRYTDPVLLAFGLLLVLCDGAVAANMSPGTVRTSPRRPNHGLVVHLPRHHE